MSDPRGRALPNAFAAYLRAWWPLAESTGAGRQGTDVINTPGVVWELKTARDWKRDFRPAAWVRQAEQHALCNCKLMCAPGCDGDSGNVPVTVYFPAGIGAANCGNTLAIVPVHVLMRLLDEAGYTPQRKEAVS